MQSTHTPQGGTRPKSPKKPGQAAEVSSMLAEPPACFSPADQDGPAPFQSPQQTAPKTNRNHSARFDYAQGGEVVFTGCTGMASLLTLGAMVKTRRRLPTGGAVTATDEAGRDIVATRLDDALETILAGIGAMGKAVAVAGGELGPTEVTHIGWLICGLSELASDIRLELGEVEIEMARNEGARNERRDTAPLVSD